jgi:hypothetical protein
MEPTGRYLDVIEITPEMIEAGISYFASMRAFAQPLPGSDEDVGELAIGVFKAMASVGKAPRHRYEAS